MAKETLVLLYGGRSAEREVSVLSAESVMRAINYDKFFVKTYFITQSGDFIKTQEFSSKPVDDEKLMTNDTVVESQKIKPSDIYEEGAIVFPVLHGPMGEDGSIQGFLEILKMPYVGTNILSSSVAMDKISTKHVLESAGVPLVAYVTYVEGSDLDAAVAEVNDKLTYPVFVKPANMGSSVGISKAEDEAALRSAIDFALKYEMIEVIPSIRELDIFLQEASRKISKSSLRFNNFIYTNNSLNTLEGKKVIVKYSPLDTEILYLFFRNQFLGTANISAG